MKILVAVKRVIDYNVQIRVKEDGSGVVTDNVKMSTNPPDDNAIEEAVKIKEAGKASEIIAVTVGEEKAQETVRKALAVGADRGVHVKVDSILEPLAVSKILKKIVEKENVIHLIMYWEINYLLFLWKVTLKVIEYNSLASLETNFPSSQYHQ